jgi:hypothetical protein
MGRVREGSFKFIGEVLYARVRYTDEYGIRREKLKKAKNISDVKRIIRKIIQELDETDLKVSSRRETMSFSELADYYEKTHMIPAEYIDGRKIEGLRSLYTHKYVIKIFREHFGSIELKKVTYDAINQFRLARFKTTTIHKKPRTLTTINREPGVLRNMFQIALRKEWITKTPFFGEKPLIMKSLEPRRERILTVDEEQDLLGQCVGRRKHLRPVIITALDTGMRRGHSSHWFGVAWTLIIV